MLFALLLTLAQVDGGEVRLPEPATPVRELLNRTVETEYVAEWLDDGTYVRFGTKENGPVHVWRPRGYRKDTAQIVIYLHGFYTNVDTAMREHRLTAQFRDSGRNALFIVPETRSWRTDPILWPELEKLLVAVEKRLRIERPKGSIVLLGHSGAYKTISGWLATPKVTDEGREPRLNVAQVLLVDGMYGDEKEFKEWLDATDAPSPRQFVLIGYDTQQRAEWLARKHPSVQLDNLPWLYDELPGTIRKAPLVTVQSERFDHMQLITEGRVLPWLLHTFR